jgi:hypothetical protein
MASAKQAKAQAFGKAFLCLWGYYMSVPVLAFWELRPQSFGHYRWNGALVWRGADGGG